MTGLAIVYVTTTSDNHAAVIELITMVYVKFKTKEISVIAYPSMSVLISEHGAVLSCTGRHVLHPRQFDDSFMITSAATAL